MSFSWKVVRTLMCIVGCVLIFGAVGTSDYYLLELNQAEPKSVWLTMITGFMLLMPTLISLVVRCVRGDEDVQE